MIVLLVSVALADIAEPFFSCDAARECGKQEFVECLSVQHDVAMPDCEPYRQLPYQLACRNEGSYATYEVYCKIGSQRHVPRRCDSSPSYGAVAVGIGLLGLAARGRRVDGPRT